STFAYRAIKQTYRTTFADDAGAIVCEADSWCFRTERDTARELKKYGKVEPYRYSPDAIERIRRAYAAEEIRGVTPRYWEDVKVGERRHLQVRRHNLIGDTTWCRGRGAAKAVVDERGEVTLDLVAVNHRDETIAQGQAVVVLPRRSA